MTFEIDKYIKSATGDQYDWYDLLRAVRSEYVMWESTHPVYFHSFNNHIAPMLDRVRLTYSGAEFGKYALFALFHDFKYDPRKSNADNVEYAVMEMQEYVDPSNDAFWEVALLIRDTLYDTKTTLNDHIALDLATLIINENCEQNEILVYREHTDIPFIEYRKNRIELLTQLEANINSSHSMYKLDIQHRVNFLKSWSPKIGIFAGSFNPFHVGHYDVFNQAKEMFDIVIIANGHNPEKAVTEDPRLPDNLSHMFHTYDGWLVDFVKGFGSNVSIVRGLRNGFDLDYEQNFKAFYYENDGVGNFVYLISAPDVAHVSSSAIRGLEKQFGTGVIKKYLVE